MTNMNTLPQAQKEFDARKQDHGTRGTSDRNKFKPPTLTHLEPNERKMTAADLKTFHRWEQEDKDVEIATRLGKFARHNAFLESEAINDTSSDYDDLTNDELEEWADQILADADDAYQQPVLPVVSLESKTPYTVGEMGRKTDKELNDALLRAATLDNDYIHDDNGDYDGDSHIRITTKSPFDK